MRPTARARSRLRARSRRIGGLSSLASSRARTFRTSTSSAHREKRRYALLCALAFLSARNGVESLVRSVQLVGILGTGAAYYFLVFEPAMLDKPPHQVFATQLAVPYLVPTAVFAVRVAPPHPPLTYRSEPLPRSRTNLRPRCSFRARAPLAPLARSC